MALTGVDLEERYGLGRDELAPDTLDDSRHCVDCDVSERDATLRMVDGEILCEKCAPRPCRTCGRALIAGERHICDPCIREVERQIEGVPEDVRARYREMEGTRALVLRGVTDAYFAARWGGTVHAVREVTCTAQTGTRFGVAVCGVEVQVMEGASCFDGTGALACKRCARSVA